MARRTDLSENEIMNAYLAAEVERRRSVYFELAREFPSLTVMFEGLKGMDFATNVREMEQMVRDLSVVDSPRAASMREIMEDHVHLLKEIAGSTTHAIRRMTGAREITLEEAVQNPIYFDEVFRTVFPTRQIAQRYVDTALASTLGMIELSRAAVSRMDPSDGTAAALASLPEPDAMNAFEIATRAYYRKEFDRVYANASS